MFGLVFGDLLGGATRSWGINHALVGLCGTSKLSHPVVRICSISTRNARGRCAPDDGQHVDRVLKLRAAHPTRVAGVYGQTKQAKAPFARSAAANTPCREPVGAANVDPNGNSAGRADVSRAGKAFAQSVSRAPTTTA